MNCCKCGKKLLAGAALCLTCEKDYESVPDENIRLGYYARHTEALTALLMSMLEDGLDHAVCRHDCTEDPDDEIITCTEDNYAACVTRWLLEPIKEAPQNETKS